MWTFVLNKCKYATGPTATLVMYSLFDDILDFWLDPSTWIWIVLLNLHDGVFFSFSVNCSHNWFNHISKFVLHFLPKLVRDWIVTDEITVFSLHKYHRSMNWLNGKHQPQQLYSTTTFNCVLLSNTGVFNY